MLVTKSCVGEGWTMVKIRVGPDSALSWAGLAPSYGFSMGSSVENLGIKPLFWATKTVFVNNTERHCGFICQQWCLFPSIP